MRFVCWFCGAAPSSVTVTGSFGAEAATRRSRSAACAAGASAVMSRLLAPDAVPLKIARREATPEKFLPYARHVNAEIVALDSGDIMLTFELQGRAFETADVRDLNDWHTKLNGMLRNLHDERLSIWTHLIRLRMDQIGRASCGERVCQYA